MPSKKNGHVINGLQDAVDALQADSDVPKLELTEAVERSASRPTPGRLFFGAAENIAEPDRPVVLVTGFMHPWYLRTRQEAGKLEARVNPAVYVAMSKCNRRFRMAMTQCTFQLAVVEVDAWKFAAHLKITDLLKSGGGEVVATEGAEATDMATRGEVDFAAPAAGGSGLGSNQRSKA